MGRVLAKLKELEIDDDTIFVFLTDNGPNGLRYNSNMKGRKGSAHEGGVRVPLFIRYPSRIKPNSKISTLAAHIDLLPTIMDLCGITDYQTKSLDGKSLVPLIDDKNTVWEERLLFTAWGGTKLKDSKKAIRSKRWRAVDERRGWELYDMKYDPDQKKNLAGINLNKLSEFKIAYKDWFREVTLEGFDPVSIQVGHKERDKVILEGHYAHLFPAETVRPNANQHGISYNGPAGWANDWVDNWKSTSAYPYWNLNVIRKGEYNILLKYACKREDVGSELRLEVSNSFIKFNVTKPFKSEMLPSADRINRKEVYERVWGTMNLGVVTLHKGLTKLKLRALEIPGREAIELKEVHLIRKR